MLIDAAIDGHGIALARTALAARDLLNGRLTIPVEVPLILPNTYWVVHPAGTASVLRVQKFKEWVLAEASEEGRKLQKSWEMFKPKKSLPS
jgi:LysR family glycine cleavage system transcriptional activator